MKHGQERLMSSSDSNSLIRFQSFEKWDDVLEHARLRLPMFYKAPLDIHPRSLLHYKSEYSDLSNIYEVKNNRILIIPRDRTVDMFFADQDHLDRFMILRY